MAMDFDHFLVNTSPSSPITASGTTQAPIQNTTSVQDFVARSINREEDGLCRLDRRCIVTRLHATSCDSVAGAKDNCDIVECRAPVQVFATCTRENVIIGRTGGRRGRTFS